MCYFEVGLLDTKYLFSVQKNPEFLVGLWEHRVYMVTIATAVGFNYCTPRFRVLFIECRGVI